MKEKSKKEENKEKDINESNNIKKKPEFNIDDILKKILESRK